MMNIAIQDAEAADRLLHALEEQLGARGEACVLVVIGGSALLALDLVDRPTQDVDVLAIEDHGRLISATPLPPGVVMASAVVARDFGLPVEWLNAGPASILDFGLPAGFLERADERVYGPALTVRYASRLDQIHFKLYATVDQGAGKHLTDLEALDPTREELVAAARWTRTHDPSEGYRSVLEKVLGHFGASDGSLDD